jgi:hypothetical protein
VNVGQNLDLVVGELPHYLELVVVQANERYSGRAQFRDPINRCALCVHATLQC